MILFELQNIIFKHKNSKFVPSNDNAIKFQPDISISQQYFSITKGKRFGLNKLLLFRLELPHKLFFTILLGTYLFFYVFTIAIIYGIFYFLSNFKSDSKLLSYRGWSFLILWSFYSYSRGWFIKANDFSRAGRLFDSKI